MAIGIALTALTACRDDNGGNGGTEPEEIVLDNTGANTVSQYDTNGAYSLNIDAGDEIHDISDLLFGIFFEDINFAADGGIYAEMVVNRSFEYNHIAQDDELYRWRAVNGAKLKADYENEKSIFIRDCIICGVYDGLFKHGSIYKNRKSLINKGFLAVTFIVTTVLQCYLKTNII